MKRAPDATSVWIVNDVLVVDGLMEGPDVVLVVAVVDDGNVGVGRVRVEGLTLGVVEVKLLIGISDRQKCGGTHSASFLGHTGLQTLKVVRFVEPGIIHVVVLVTIVGDILVESDHWVAEHGLDYLSRDDRVERDVQTIVKLQTVVLIVSCLTLVHSR